MKWITREKVKVDRVACPWLIQKLYDALYAECRTQLSLNTRSSV